MCEFLASVGDDDVSTLCLVMFFCHKVESARSLPGSSAQRPTVITRTALAVLAGSMSHRYSQRDKLKSKKPRPPCAGYDLRDHRMSPSLA